jgi:hypothetical protein
MTVTAFQIAGVRPFKINMASHATLHGGHVVAGAPPPPAGPPASVPAGLLPSATKVLRACSASRAELLPTQ